MFFQHSPFLKCMSCFSERELELIRVKKGNQSHNNGRIGKKHARSQKGGRCMNKWRDSRKVFLTAIAFGTMLNPLNSSMISLALHQIQHEFGLSFTTVSWLISSFYLASAVTQNFMSGRIGDHVMSRRTLFLFGLGLVAVSAICAPFAPTFAVLIVIRPPQAIGSSAIYPSGVGLIRDHIKEKQASALAVLSIFASAMTALGPTLGGFLMTIGGWLTIF